jgi:hypothetical protein
MLEDGRCLPITAQDQRPRVEQLAQAFARRMRP